MTAPTLVNLTIEGRAVSVPAGTSILEAAGEQQEIGQAAAQNFLIEFGQFTGDDGGTIFKNLQHDGECFGQTVGAFIKN